MAAYRAFNFSLTTTPAKALDAEPFDRAVTLNPPNNNAIQIGYDGASGFYLRPGGDTGSSTYQGSGADVWYTKFVLPAGEELWAWVDSGTSGVAVLVSKA